eukprot:CAMPEP_0113445992 /NCGR_PEP_ID=MMETSP0014_2-20120614/3473_1 /TAXON_ID=2857 /ORGANISM="Nitzschia sp." /LENGTH=218 /DNA_ID=CAMNT_0000337063 /DNA_START=25 /DNA_END=677 /DNA_ORIENTATION=+ /assembly_acc=CAM_ASM_000159
MGQTQKQLNSNDLRKMPLITDNVSIPPAPHGMMSLRPRRRQVHFEASIDWNEESIKSSRGSEVRRERSDKKRQKKMNDEKRYDSVLEITTNQDEGANCISARFMRLYNGGDDPNLRTAVNTLIGHQPGGRQTFHQSLNSFRADGQSYSQLTRRQQECVRILSGLESITTEFRAELPAEPVSEESSESDDAEERREKKRRRKWSSVGEATEKRNNRQGR